MITSVFAVDSAGGMGRNGSLPWPRDSSDLRFFKTITSGGIVLMGRKTWMDPMLPKPLPNRYNVVMSSDQSQLEPGWDMVIHPKDLEVCIGDLSIRYPEKDIFVIGGAQTLIATRHLIDSAYITEFRGDYDCDVRIDVPSYVEGLRCDEEVEIDNKIVRHYT